MLNEVHYSKMSDRQRSFREKYRKQVQGWYNGFLHVSIIYSIGFLLLFYFYLNIKTVNLLEYLIIPITFVFVIFLNGFYIKKLCINLETFQERGQYIQDILYNIINFLLKKK